PSLPIPSDTSVFLFSRPPPPPTPPLFPYPTLSRSPGPPRASWQWRSSRFHRRFLIRGGGPGAAFAQDLDDGEPGFLVALVRRQRSEEHTSELQSLTNIVCRLLL